MARITVNPDAEVKSFEAVKDGSVVKLRVEQCITADDGGPITSPKSGNRYYRWRLSVQTPKDELLGVDGEALKGMPGGIFYTTVIEPESQGMLRALVEAALGAWDEFDTQDLIGKEFDAVLKVTKDNNDEDRNEIKKILKED